jgi:hypothetical protein
LMRLHGGQVSVASELGRGATFTLEFPPHPPDGPEDQGFASGLTPRTGTGGS